MSYQHKPDRGSIFINDRKTNEHQPDYRGDANINGQEVWVSGWVNTRPDGSQYFSLAFQSKEAVHNQGMENARQAVAGGIPTPQLQQAPQQGYAPQQAPAPAQYAPSPQQAPAPAQYSPSPQQAPHQGQPQPPVYDDPDIPF